jgi:hypothetical protein
MKTIELNLFDLDELNEAAQEKAHNEFIANSDNPWESENRDSLNAFAEFFPVRIKDWEYGYRNFINWTSDVKPSHNELNGIRLLKHLHSEYMPALEKGKYLNHIKGKAHYSKVQKEISCPFTGYYMDDVLIDPLLKFIKNPEEHISMEDLLSDCLQSWVFACRDDHESTQTMEYFKEMSDVNGWTYEENGVLRHG